jgi:hypothetical protein
MPGLGLETSGTGLETIEAEAAFARVLAALSATAAAAAKCRIGGSGFWVQGMMCRVQYFGA